MKPNYSLTAVGGNISGNLINGGGVNIIHRVLHRAGIFLPKWQCNRLAMDRTDTYSASYYIQSILTNFRTRKTTA